MTWYQEIHCNSAYNAPFEEELAASLDKVRRHSKATVVFFAAGTAPGHDSFNYLKRVQSHMKEASIVYEAESVWKVMALISQAEAVLSTSLHVRIMAFIHFEPRVTWCSEPKCTGNSWSFGMLMTQLVV